MAALQVGYEWVVEDIDEHDDIIDTNAWDTPEEALKQYAWPLRDDAVRRDICLTRNAGNNEEGLQDRQWAYFYEKDGRWHLPTAFDGGKLVPQEYHRQLTRAQRRGA
jgi:hypothetical protein